MKGSVCRAGLLAVALTCLSVSGGCAAYARTRDDLVEQARRGIDLAGESLQAKGAVVEAEFTARRDRLDRAFDADARRRLTPDVADWVIEARLAYGVAVDALHDARQAELANAAIDRRNLSAARSALDRLRRLHELETLRTPTGRGYGRTQEAP